ncbi:hypothetical protein QOZ92_000774 [Paeniclostridium ghonii]|uniref:Methionine synthase n=2 Tax=Paraclostridium ghonii TaxID=29358 RepID=A0ABU0MXN2_9FIRM|nr:hypothetical protein [Paeniclostridium ghonii]
MENNMHLKNINIDYYEVLRYLEYNGQQIDNSLKELVHKCISSTKNIIKPLYISKTYSIEKRINEAKEYIVCLRGSNIKIKSKDLYDVLEGCDQCIITATTLGVDIDREIKKSGYLDLTKMIILDSCATTAIESVCDIIENSYREEFKKCRKHITNRYSPGYGDLPINVNEDFINILEAQNKIGLTITKNHIMIPRKSVIWIAGISDKMKYSSNKSCLKCNNYNTCKYRKEAVNCGD